MKVNPNHLLFLAMQRVKIPTLPFRVEYDADVDTLYWRFKEGVAPTHSADDAERGLVYDYCEKELIGIEILDASQEF
jgi:uncharacterized protein YuzE